MIEEVTQEEIVSTAISDYFATGDPSGVREGLLLVSRSPKVDARDRCSCFCLASHLSATLWSCHSDPENADFYIERHEVEIAFQREGVLLALAQYAG